MTKVERLVVLIATVWLWVAAALGLFLIVILLGAPEGGSGTMLAAFAWTMVMGGAALSANSSQMAGRIAIALALSSPLVVALIVMLGG